jgi:hypothetical protein
MRRSISPATIRLLLAAFLWILHDPRMSAVLLAGELPAGLGPEQAGHGSLSTDWFQESYEPYEASPRLNFSVRNFWMRADLRVRPEWRHGVCFGGGPPVNGACNALGADGIGTSAFPGKSANDSYVQQWARLGIGYDLSTDLNFYLEIQDSATW